MQAASQAGFFVLNNIQAGNITLVYRADGYIQAEKVITVTADIVSGGAADISMSPVLAPDAWRAVLQWGETPFDLDTYVKWPWGFQINWQRLQVSGKGILAKLEHDDTNSYGPETAFISGTRNCRGNDGDCDVMYSVNDYGQTGSMKTTPVVVMLYNGDHVAGEWKIGGTECKKSVRDYDDWWDVFAINGQTNELVWSCNMGPYGTVRPQGGLNLKQFRNRRSHNVSLQNVSLPVATIAKPSIKAHPSKANSITIHSKAHTFPAAHPSKANSTSVHSKPLASPAAVRIAPQSSKVSKRQLQGAKASRRPARQEKNSPPSDDILPQGKLRPRHLRPRLRAPVKPHAF
jgi:hypothetical protein